MDVLTGFGTVGSLPSVHLEERLPTNSRYEYRETYIDYVLAPPATQPPINWGALADPGPAPPAEDIAADRCMIVEALEENADRGDCQLFTEQVEAIDWSARQPGELALAVRMALNKEWLTVAQNLAKQGEALFPEDEELQRIVRTLAPPITRIVPGDPPYGLAASRLWLRTHAHNYHGQWVAVYDGQLLAAAPSLEELRVRMGALKQPASTIITRVL